MAEGRRRLNGGAGIRERSPYGLHLSVESRRHGHDIALDRAADFALGGQEFVSGLQVHPELGIGSEKAAEAQCIIGGQASPALYEFIYPWLGES